MFSKEFLELLVEVITSWQVIGITIALLLFLKIVFNAAKAYRRPKMKLAGKIKLRLKKSKSNASLGDGAEIIHEEDGKDELGLEEA
ncbi:MAG: hypothetical protein FWC19_06620 [Treponema sp.]|nr:hypothetical protein [Treponema sp.]MCL2272458.1 hypothetical protein [Treponema sp.]